MGILFRKYSGDRDKCQYYEPMILRKLNHQRSLRDAGGIDFISYGPTWLPDGTWYRFYSQKEKDGADIDFVEIFSPFKAPKVRGKKYIVPLLWPAYEVYDEENTENRGSGVIIAQWEDLKPLFFASFGTRRYLGPPTYQYAYDDPEYYEMPDITQYKELSSSVPYPCNIVDDPDCQEWNEETNATCLGWDYNPTFEYHAVVHWERIMTVDGEVFYHKDINYTQDEIDHATCQDHWWVCDSNPAYTTHYQTEREIFNGEAIPWHWWAGSGLNLPFSSGWQEYIFSDSGYDFIAYDIANGAWESMTEYWLAVDQCSWYPCKESWSGSSSNTFYVKANNGDYEETYAAAQEFTLSSTECVLNNEDDFTDSCTYSGKICYGVWGGIFYKWDVEETEMEHIKDNEVMLTQVELSNIEYDRFDLSTGMALSFLMNYVNPYVDYHCFWDTDKHSHRAYDLNIASWYHYFKEENGEIVGSTDESDRWLSWVNMILVRLDKKFAKKKFGISHVPDTDIQWVDIGTFSIMEE